MLMKVRWKERLTSLEATTSLAALSAILKIIITDARLDKSGYNCPFAQTLPPNLIDRVLLPPIPVLQFPFMQFPFVQFPFIQFPFRGWSRRCKKAAYALPAILDRHTFDTFDKRSY